MSEISIFAPAKLNLFLAITGRRPDGFHELVSVAVQLNFGDTLRALPAAEGEFTLTCDDVALPVDESNLVIKAARRFVAETGWRGGVRFFLEKRVPMGAGLGGGSSDGVAALRMLEALSGSTLSGSRRAALAAELGSDCALFLHGGPVVMRGRGEKIAELPATAARRLRGRRVVVFKPAFGIATPWAYARLAAGAPASYVPAEAAEAKLEAWLADESARAEALLGNSMEAPAFAKFVALPTLLAKLRAEFGISPRMSGSGSACFALLEEDSPLAEIERTVRAAWGGTSFVVETRIR